MKNSTLVIGVAVSLVLVVAATLIVEAVAPRLANWAFLPALAFVVVYINVVRSKAPRARDDRPPLQDTPQGVRPTKDARARRPTIERDASTRSAGIEGP